MTFNCFLFIFSGYILSSAPEYLPVMMVNSFQQSAISQKQNRLAFLTACGPFPDTV